MTSLISRLTAPVNMIVPIESTAGLSEYIRHVPVFAFGIWNETAEPEPSVTTRPKNEKGEPGSTPLNSTMMSAFVL